MTFAESFRRLFAHPSSSAHVGMRRARWTSSRSMPGLLAEAAVDPHREREVSRPPRGKEEGHDCRARLNPSVTDLGGARGPRISRGEVDD